MSDPALNRLRQVLAATDDALDDVTRARVLARLGPTMDELAAREPRVPVSRVRGVLLPLAAVATLIGLVVGLSHVLRRPALDEAPRESAGLRVLLPYAMTADPQVDHRRTSSLLGRRQRGLQVPQGVELRALLGERASVALVGPARLDVMRVEVGDLAVRLSRGTLVTSFDGTAGGQLQIHAAGTVTEVVGTLFMVQVARQRTTVAVAHGKVRVRHGGRTWIVGEGQMVSGDGTLQPIPTGVDQLFRRFEQRGEDRGRPVARHRRQARSGRGMSRAPLRDPGRTPGDAPGVPRAQADPGPAAAADPVPPAPDAKPLPEHRTASEQYRLAELAMRQGSNEQARRRLEQLVRQFAQDPLACQARYELARLALRCQSTRQQLALAARELDAVIGGVERRLHEPASYLRCQVELRQSSASRAARCFREYRVRFPGSPHDAAALAHLMVLADRGRDCVYGRALAVEFLKRYPAAAHADTARQLLRRCR